MTLHADIQHSQLWSFEEKMFPFDNIVGERTVQCRCYIQRDVTKLVCIIFCSDFKGRPRNVLLLAGETVFILL